MATSPIDLSSGLVPKTGDIDLSAGLKPAAQTPSESSFFGDLGQAAIGAGKSALRSVYNSGMTQGPPYLQGSGLNINTAAAPAAVQPSNTSQKVGGYLETGMEVAAPFLLGGATLAEAAPNAKRAGQALGAIETAIGSAPVDTSDAMVHAQRVADLGNLGHGSPPAPIASFLKRMAIKSEGDVVTQSPSNLTFNEARDLYSAARDLTVQQLQSTTGKVQHEVYQFANSLGDSLSQTAAANGQGAQYAAAMKDYAKAKTLGDLIDIAKKWGIRGAVGGLAGAATYGLVKDAMGVIGQ